VSTTSQQQTLQGTRTLSVLQPPPSHRSVSVAGGSVATRPSWVWLAGSDAIAAVLTLMVTSNLLASLAPERASVATNLEFVVLCTAALAGAALAKRVYPRARRRIVPAPADDLANLEATILTGALVALAGAALVPALRRGPLQPEAVAVGFAACAAVIPLARAAAIALRVRSATRPARVVVLGTGTIATDVGARLARSPHVELVGFVDDDPVDGQPVLGDLGELPAICEYAMVDRVVVAFSRSHPGRTTDLLRSLSRSVAVDVVPRYFELTGWDASFQDLDGLAVISLDGGGAGLFGRAVKRAFDVTGALIGLLVATPILLLAIAAIKVSSPGPVFFSQRRLGKGRQPFAILKLRTMRQPGPAESTLGNRSMPVPLTRLPDVAPRVTPVGRVLRRLGIDELPQLINVLRGDMSLVGPRPFVPEECTVLPSWVDRRFEVRPGMTGLWQVCGQHDLRFEELCRLDCQYVASWSFAGDMRILARTPGRLVRGGGGWPPA
jgi:exopolysaccharide biosynthesis polyprenyl glycosylphosphotransferase